MSTTTSDIAAGDDRTTAQFFFEVGYIAAWADAYMANGKKAALPISDESIERAWAIAPEAHDDREEWDRHMAATQQPPLRIIKDAEPVARSLQIRSPLNRAIYQAIRDFRMGNMCDEDGYPWPLVDLMSNPAPCDISTGEEEMVSLADEVCEAVEAMSPWQPIETAPGVKGKYFFCRLAWGPEGNRCTGDGFRWNGRWFAAALFYNSARFDECQHEFRQIEVKPTHFMEHPSAPSQIEEG